ncbi:hypothetical protein B7486_25995 [cyanobacterium TDX16]|nr:hypothetical protein B7486_25995 [cyanobacterium TDX16]
MVKNRRDRLETRGLGLGVGVVGIGDIGRCLAGHVGIISMYQDLLRVRAGFAGSSQVRLKPAEGEGKRMGGCGLYSTS